jgi:hypothetical protein
LGEGSLHDIIASAKKRNCIPDGIIINSWTVRQKLK